MGARKDKDNRPETNLDPVSAAINAGIDAAASASQFVPIADQDPVQTTESAQDQNPKSLEKPPLADRSDADIALDDLAELKCSLNKKKKPPVIVMLDDDVAFDDFALALE